MEPVFDKGQTTAWLTTLFNETAGYINVVSTGNWAGKCFTSIPDAVNYVELLDKRKPAGIYVRMTTLRDAPKDGARGSVEHTSEFIGLWGDLDITGPGHKHHVCDGDPCSSGDVPGHRANRVPLIADEAMCLELIERTGLPAPTEWVSSGGGMYPIWLTLDPWQVADERKQVWASELSANWQRVIQLTAEKMGVHYGAGVGDLTRVLRIPGTVNRKVPDAPTMCEWRMDLSLSTPYTLDRLDAAASEALRRLEPPKPAPSTGYVPQPATVAGTRPGDAFNAATTWPQLLEADGATVFRDNNGGYIQWTRPGKDKRDGPSGTTGYRGSDVLKVMSDSWHPLQQDKTYDRFGYYAAMQHNGNIPAATKALVALGYGEKLQRTTTVQADMGYDYEASGFTAADAPTPEQVADGVAKKMAERTGVKPTYTYTDSGIADRLQARHGSDWRFVASRQRNGWLKWNGSTWQPDTKGAVTNLVDRIVQEEYARAAEEEDEKAADRIRAAVKPMLSNSKQVGATTIFGRRDGIGIDPDELDAHKLKMTCSNGVVDLATMECGPHDRSLLATKKLGTAYDKTATAPRWEKFLEDVLPDPAIRSYLQRAVGYTLLGKPNAKAIFLLHGESNTGKSQVINILSKIFGDFAQGAKEQTFRINDSATAATPGLHKLRGARLVTTSETTEGVRLDESLIKQLTGGDIISSRPLYGDEEQWTPEFSIWLATNHLPKFNSDDNAIWRRVKPIHFGVVFGKEGREDVLDIGRSIASEEGPGILNWMLAGVAAYREHGLAQPEALTAGVTAYQRESDPVGRFIDAGIAEGGIVADPAQRIEAKQLYAWFTAWCAEEGIRYPLPSNRFGLRLAALGYEKCKSADGSKRMWRGLQPGTQTWLVSGHPLRT